MRLQYFERISVFLYEFYPESYLNSLKSNSLTNVEKNPF